MKFFVLVNPKGGRGIAVTDFAPVDGSHTGDAPRCDTCGNYVGLRPLLFPVRVELECWGSKWGDIAFGPGDQLLISGRLRRAFAEAGLNGFTLLDPVEVAKVRRRQPSMKGNPPDYWLATLARSEAVLDERASGLERGDGSVCTDCGLGGVIKRIHGVVLRPNTWSGEDVFFARGLPGTILTSERFKSLCENAGFANRAFLDAQMFSFDHYPQERPAGSSRRH
jgi:hypothetical protein